MKVLLIVGAIAAGISLVGESLSLAFPPLTDEQELGDNPLGALIILLGLGVAVLQLVIYVATVVAFLMWIYRAYDNLRAFNPWARFDYSPGWAVGSFFIPFVCLVIPYRAVREVWQKSTPPDEALMFAPKPPAWFPLWWLFWLSSMFADNISFRVSLNESVDESTGTIISIVASVLSIIAALFAYLVVDEIDKRQEETSAKVKLGQFSGPPPPPTNLPMPEVVTPAP
ncbi:MAG TPA: DUF4328 domain-containing protein [Pyrinomonadaceae bacterium]|nr:DUF4328 domain-containing protein [Pyrinomonadaceae bacterium]